MSLASFSLLFLPLDKPVIKFPYSRQNWNKTFLLFYDAFEFFSNLPFSHHSSVCLHLIVPFIKPTTTWTWPLASDHSNQVLGDFHITRCFGEYSVLVLCQLLCSTWHLEPTPIFKAPILHFFFFLNISVIKWCVDLNMPSLPHTHLCPAHVIPSSWDAFLFIPLPSLFGKKSQLSFKFQLRHYLLWAAVAYLFLCIDLLLLRLP